MVAAAINAGLFLKTTTKELANENVDFLLQVKRGKRILLTIYIKGNPACLH
jgi:hypothetical protein